MIARLSLIMSLLLLCFGVLSCGGTPQPSQETEAGVTAGGEGKRLEIEAKFTEVRDKIRPKEGDPILIADGEKQYKRKCSFCHGVDGQKKIPLAMETAHRVSMFAPDDIAVQIHSGVNIHGKVRNHKTFQTLNGAELYATLLFVQNFFLQGREGDQWGPWKARLAQGESQFGTHCSNCHVADGAARTFDREYLLTTSPQSMKESITAQAAHGGAGFDTISEEDRWAIAYWLQSQLYQLP